MVYPIQEVSVEFAIVAKQRQNGVSTGNVSGEWGSQSVDNTKKRISGWNMWKQVDQPRRLSVIQRIEEVAVSWEIQVIGGKLNRRDHALDTKYRRHSD